MEPIPESVEAVEEYGPFSDRDLIGDLTASATEVCALVPDCVGLSLAIYQHGVTLTLVATRSEIAALDARDESDRPETAPVTVTLPPDHESLLDEQDWAVTARSTAADRVASTLTLPIVTAERVTGSIDLYAASAGAFTAHHAALAAIFGAWAPGAVTDADLDFTTRTEARDAPRLQREEVHILRAAGLLADVLGVDIDQARVEIRASAQSTGISETMLSEFVIKTLGTPPDDTP